VSGTELAITDLLASNLDTAVELGTKHVLQVSDTELTITDLLASKLHTGAELGATHVLQLSDTILTITDFLASKPDTGAELGATNSCSKGEWNKADHHIPADKQANTVPVAEVTLMDLLTRNNDT
jgi:hypothetical protein